MKRIVLRILAVIPSIGLQLIWFYILARFLEPWTVPINIVLSLLALLFVLYLITKHDEGTYKVLWLLVILPFPIFGAALYLFFGNKGAIKPLRKKLDKAPPLPPQTLDPQVYSFLEEQDHRMADTFHYLQDITGFIPVMNQSAKYYSLGDDLFPAMLEELEKAERFIFVEYFIVEPGEMWDSMVEIMARKAAQGVDVRVLFDDLGSISTFFGENVKALWQKGIQCYPFNPLVFISGTLNYRDHRKMLVIDNRVAFSGGVNLADEYINQRERFGHWKDIGIRITGPAVENYTRMFAEFWNAFTFKPVPEDLFDAIPAEGISDGCVLSYYDSPLRSKAASNELYVELLSQAKDYAWFFTPYLMLGDTLLDAFIRAAHRGVDVRIIMPGVPDKRLVFRMSRSFYPVLLDAGVKIYEYTPGFVHAKGCVIDDMAGTVGTVNLDYRSLFLHFENNALFYQASLLKDIKSDFLNTQKLCQEMRMGENVKIGFWHWTLDGILRIFAPLC